MQCSPHVCAAIDSLAKRGTFAGTFHAIFLKESCRLKQNMHFEVPFCECAPVSFVLFFSF